MTSQLNEERLKIKKKLESEKRLIHCLEGDNLKENNEKRIKKINNILDTLRKLNPNLKKERQSIVSFDLNTHDIENNIHNSPSRRSDISIDTYMPDNNRKKKNRKSGFPYYESRDTYIEQLLKFRNEENNINVNHPPRKKINQRKDEDLFVQMCFKIKNEKKQNPHLFHLFQIEDQVL